MLKLKFLNEGNYNEVMKEIENKQDIETTFRTYTTLDTSDKRYSVYSIYVEYRDVADFGSRNYQWVLAGYTDNGVLYLTADEILDYNLKPYMNGEVITNLKEMIQDYPEAFYIEDDIAENLNEDTLNSFKVGDLVRSKLPKRTTSNTMAFSGTIIDINRNGLCTIECADGTVIDGIRQDRLVHSKASRGI